jgi:hypothetical protein
VYAFLEAAEPLGRRDALHVGYLDHVDQLDELGVFQFVERLSEAVSWHVNA